MKRLLIYPAILPIFAVLSLFIALWQRGLSSPLTMPTLERSDYGTTWDGWAFAGLIFDLLLVPMALGLDFFRNRAKDISLGLAAQNFAAQWAWLSFYAALLTALHAAMLPILKAVPLESFQSLLDLAWELISSHENTPFLCHGLAFMVAILRTTARKPSPSPPFLWCKWRQFWTLQLHS